MLLSVIVPCFNEEGNIDLFYEETVKALGDLMPETELIFVNDGSRDATLAKLRALCARARYRVRVVSFSRNFGKEAALLAGLRSSTGEFTSIIDADLQQRPSYIVEMMDFLKEHPEYDAVAAYQEERKEGFILSLFKKMFYNVIDSMTDVKIMQAASDFRVLRRPVVDAILSLPEKCRFSKGIFAWVGFETYYMPYKVEERASGTSKSRRLFYLCSFHPVSDRHCCEDDSLGRSRGGFPDARLPDPDAVRNRTAGHRDPRTISGKELYGEQGAPCLYCQRRTGK